MLFFKAVIFKWYFKILLPGYADQTEYTRSIKIGQCYNLQGA